MSLQDIRAMRMKRLKPSGYVSVVFGQAPRHLRDELLIEVLPGSQPEFNDWRPLVGLWVAFFHKDANRDLILRTVSAVDAAGAKLLGFAENGIGYPLGIFETNEAKQKTAYLLSREWEALCR